MILVQYVCILRMAITSDTPTSSITYTHNAIKSCVRCMQNNSPGAVGTLDGVSPMASVGNAHSCPPAQSPETASILSSILRQEDTRDGVLVERSMTHLLRKKLNFSSKPDGTQDDDDDEDDEDQIPHSGCQRWEDRNLCCNLLTRERCELVCHFMDGVLITSTCLSPSGTAQ